MERYGLDGAVEFVKGISDAELVDLVRSAQVACVPSLYEGFSLPAAEAMATGTPLLATTGGAIPEVAGRDGETCLAVPPGDSDALAAGLGRLLGDAELRARLGAAGRQRVLRHFTWARAAEGTVARYREAIARSQDGETGRSASPDARSTVTPLASGGSPVGGDRSASVVSGGSVAGGDRSASLTSGGSAVGADRSVSVVSGGSASQVSDGSTVGGDHSTPPAPADPAGPASGRLPAAGVDQSASAAPGRSAAPAGAVSAATTDVEGVNSESRATC
jgi:hypothetical protein